MSCSIRITGCEPHACHVSPPKPQYWFLSSSARNLFALFITVALTIATYTSGYSAQRPRSLTSSELSWMSFSIALYNAQTGQP